MARRVRVAALSLGLAVLPTLGLACSGDDATSGKRVVLHTRASGKTASTYPARNGWTVELSKAAIGVAAFHYFEGAPVVSRRDPWLRSLFLKTAHAHPGHYQEGTALGQMLTPASVDLLSGAPVTLGDGDGVTGVARSARFTLGTGEGDLAGRVAITEGKAQKGTASVFFRLVATPAELEKTAVGGKVEGCPYGPADVESDGTVTVTVDPGVWLGFVDFEGVAPGTVDAPTEPGPDDTSRIGFVLGVGQASAYRFAFSTP